MNMVLFAKYNSYYHFCVQICVSYENKLATTHLDKDTTVHMVIKYFFDMCYSSNILGIHRNDIWIIP